METLQTILLAVILYFIIDTAFARVRVDNISMIPTLKPGEFLLVNKLSYRFGDLQRGDIIVFHAPVNPSEDYIKRTIGLPGETIRVEDGQVYVNDVAISEPYLKKAIAYEGSWEVPEDTVFVLGDNRNQSSDSHSWGFVPQENVVGKALVIYWPFNEVTVLKVADAY
ncbi:MAG: signal peptidase I [Anaerolineaceae bacterium]|nr:signal peptidase I [Anaerolineaceae bacterium]